MKQKNILLIWEWEVKENKARSLPPPCGSRYFPVISALQFDLNAYLLFLK